MSITLNIYYSGANGSAKSFASEMMSRGIVGRIRKSPGNEKYEYFFPMDESETVLLIDRWSNQASIDNHHNSPMMTEILVLREKYDLHMRVERFISDDDVPSADEKYIRH